MALLFWFPGPWWPKSGGWASWGLGTLLGAAAQGPSCSETPWPLEGRAQGQPQPSPRARGFQGWVPGLRRAGSPLVPSPFTLGPAPPLLCSPHPSHIQAILSPVQPTTQAGPLLSCLSACPSPLPGLLAPLTLPLTLQDESQRKLSKTHIWSCCFPAPHSAMTPWCLKALHILPLPLTVFAPPGCSPMGQPALSPQHLPTSLLACSFFAPRLG